MAKDADKKDEFADVPHERQGQRPDYSTSKVTSKPIPKSIQDTLNSDEKMGELMDSTEETDMNDTSARYAAYAARARTILRAGHRYIAYTSDIGESFRPVAHPILIRSAYAVSWLYLAGDVGFEGYKAYQRNQTALRPELHGHHAGSAAAAAAASPEPGAAVAGAQSAIKDLVKPTPGRIAPIDDYRTVMAERAIFQSVASMGLPAFTIHSVVKYSGKALKNASNKTIRTYGPIGLGLAVVPALPYLFDEPVEHAVSWAFHKGFEAFGGKKAVDPLESKKEL